MLDPFCGCGTAIAAAHKLNRRWVGIDITTLAIAIMRARLKDSFGLENIEAIGQPADLDGARQLAQSPEGRYQFQWWALGLIDARPVGGVRKKGPDRGIDGVITFTGVGGKLETVIVSVKSGHVTRAMVEQLRGTIEREKAAIGIFITLDEPTPQMRREAVAAGRYHSETWRRDYPRLQILTIRELLKQGRRPNLPPFVMPTYPLASRVPVAVGAEQQSFLTGDKEPSVLPLKPEDSPAAPAQAPVPSGGRGSERPPWPASKAALMKGPPVLATLTASRVPSAVPSRLHRRSARPGPPRPR